MIFSRTWLPWSYATSRHLRFPVTRSPPLHCPAGNCTSGTSSASEEHLTGSDKCEQTCGGSPENKVSVPKAEADEVLAFSMFSKFLETNVFNWQRKTCDPLTWGKHVIMACIKKQLVPQILLTPSKQENNTGQASKNPWKFPLWWIRSFVGFLGDPPQYEILKIQPFVDPYLTLRCGHCKQMRTKYHRTNAWYETYFLSPVGVLFTISSLMLLFCGLDQSSDKLDMRQLTVPENPWGRHKKRAGFSQVVEQSL